MDIVGERILLARRRQKIQQKVLAARAQISPKHLSQIETGKVAGLHMQAALLRRMAQVLGVSADYLLGLDEPGESTCHSHSESPKKARGRPKTQV